MAETIAKLTDERQILQNRIVQLEDQCNIKLPFEDPVARANHLFGRYLRSESYRKALIWQKRYLIALLVTYQSHPISDELLLNNFEPKHSTRTKSKGKMKFK